MNMANIFTRNKRAVSDRAESVDAIATVGQHFTVSGDVAVGRGPIGDLAVDPDTNAVVATNDGAGSVSIINPETLAVEGIVAVGADPFAVAVANDRAYVSTGCMNYDAITVIDTNTKTVIAQYPLAFSITAVAVSPDGKRVYAGRTGTDYVDIAVIDTTAERAGTIDIATGPGINIDAVRIDASGKRLYVGTSDARGSRLVSVNVETAQVEAAVRIGAPIRDLALGVDATAYVLTSDRTHGGAVEIVDLSTNKVTDTVEIGCAPVQLALSADGTRAYIVDYDHVAVLCTLTNEVLNNIEVSARPSCVALSADGDRLYVADYAGTVTTFSVASTKPLLYSQFLPTDRIPVQLADWSRPPSESPAR